jgi:hypothetical protein
MHASDIWRNYWKLTTTQSKSFTDIFLRCSENVENVQVLRIQTFAPWGPLKSGGPVQLADRFACWIKHSSVYATANKRLKK